MKKVFKALSAVVLSALVLCGAVMLSGCNDFGFNPIGEWVNTKVTIGGEEFATPYGKDAKFCFVFRHNGTAYMTLNGEYVDNSDFTYTYNDEKVVLKSENNNGAEIEYTVKNNGTALESTDSNGTVNVFERI